MPKAATGAGQARTDAIEAFFAELTSKGREPLLQRTVGTVRFDLSDGGSMERWYVAIEKGELRVSHRNAKADAVMRAEKSLFELILTGKTNAMAAILRGAVQLEGDFQLAVRVERLFPGPPSSSLVQPNGSTTRSGGDAASHGAARKSKKADKVKKAARPTAKRKGTK